MPPTIGNHTGVITEVEFLRARADEAEATALLQALERDARVLATEPGFLAASVHVSDDDAIIVWRQWANDASWRASATDTRRPTERGQVNHLGQHDVATYEAEYANTASGGPLSIEPGGHFATLIDLQVTDASRQRQILGFNIANSEAFSAQPGLRATAVLRGRDGTRIATYSQWDHVEDWIAAVKANAAERVPGIKAAQTVRDVNAMLQEASREIGSVPEYHAYRVKSVIGS